MSFWHTASQVYKLSEITSLLCIAEMGLQVVYYYMYLGIVEQAT